MSKLSKFFQYLIFILRTYQSIVKCKFLGIKLGSGSGFWGPSKFVKYPSSTIEFGNNCRFRSGNASNLIGINHLCIFSTHSSHAVLKVGNNCGFSGTVIGCFEEIIIGNNVRCGANALITDSDWHTSDTRVGPPRPIKIGDNVWLGYGSIVLKGVTIGNNTVIGAGSVVVRDIPANVIATGNPCKVVKVLGIQ